MKLAWLTRGARELLVACVPTADTTSGPLYRRGAPWRTSLCSPDEPGDPLTITGTVTALPDCGPVSDATLDVWQTNARGLYSNLLGFGDPANPRTFHLRGRMRTDQQGRYRFDSIVPGRYPLFWPFTRPRHIHMIVTHPSCEPLTTQIYFEGDEYNQPWALPLISRELVNVDGRAHGWLPVSFGALRAPRTAIRLSAEPYNEYKILVRSRIAVQWDPWWNAALTIRLETGTDATGRRRREGVFDIVLKPRRQRL